MEVVTIGMIIFFIAFTILSIIMIRKSVKIFFFITLGITLIFIALFVWVFLDVIDMQKYFQNSSKIVFLEDNNLFLTGLVLSEEPVLLNKTSLYYYSDLYKKKDYKVILGKHYKLMVFSIKTIEDLPDPNYYIQDIMLSKQDIIEALQSDNPSKYLTEDPLLLPEGEDWVKALIFSSVLIQGIMDMKNPLYFFEQYKKGNIFIYPETPIFKVMKFIPLDLIKSVAEKTAEKLLVRKTMSET